MKRFISYVLSMKTNACYIFTAILLFYSLSDIIWGGTGLTGVLILEVMGLSMLCGMVQVLVYSDLIFKRMAYTPRTVLLGLVLLVLVTGFAILFHWFPVDRAVGWLAFLGIFLLVFLGLTVGFEVVFRLTGRRYTSLLLDRQEGER